MHVGIGISSHAEADSAGRECGRRALAELGGGPGLALAFCGGRHDPAAFAAALREQLPAGVPLVGGAAVAAMAADLRGMVGYESAVCLLPASLGEAAVAVVDDLGEREIEAGRRLGQDLRPLLEGPRELLVFYDSVACAEPSVLHVGSRLVAGLHEAFEACGTTPAPLFAGAGMLADVDLRSGYILDGDGPRRHAAIGLALPAGLSMETAIMHGCTPASAFLRITRIEGAEVLELDGRPAIAVVAEALGLSVEAVPDQRLSLALALGEKHGDPFAPFDERHYVNRLVMNADPERGSVTLFEADFREGSLVQLMVTDTERLCDSVDERMGELRAAAGPPPLLAVYIDCAGRSPACNGALRDEADLVREHLADWGVPWLGFYSGVEIAPLMGRTRPLDWTGVLLLLRPSPAARSGGGPPRRA